MFVRLTAAVATAARASRTAASAMPPTAHTPLPYAGPKIDEILKLRAKFAHPSIFQYYKKPIAIVEGSMQYLYDESGRRYLDMIAGIVTISCGHCHPKIVEAATSQIKRLMHTTTIYSNDQNSLYVSELAAKFPEELRTVYVVNSGSEANDLAVAMARAYTGNTAVLALRNCYHGMSYGSMGLTSLHTWKQNIPHGQHIYHTMNPDPYRGPFGSNTDAYIEELRQTIRFETSGRIAGLWAEPIQGIGGTAELTPDYLKKAAPIVREHGGLVVADEVQTGFGRTGDHYWGFQMMDIMPDIVVMAKGIGNGFPMAAVACRREIAEKLTSRLTFNTYGGNPVASAVGRAVLRVIDEDGLQRNSKTVGTFIKDGMKKLQESHAIIGDVRGKGLMLGLELVKDRKTKAPAAEETAQIFETLKDKGVLVGKGGLYGNVLRIKPPMCITMDDAEFFLDTLAASLKAL